jgi:hypothetical protein
MGLRDQFKAAHAVTHHTDGRVELAQSLAFGADPGQALEVTAADPALKIDGYNV